MNLTEARAQLARIVASGVRPKRLRQDIQSVLELMPDFADRSCVHCGCTDGRACPGGCHWVELHTATPTGICSQCASQFRNEAGLAQDIEAVMHAILGQASDTIWILPPFQLPVVHETVLDRLQSAHEKARLLESKT